jgi:DNA polymerase-3 subunit delta'
MAWDVIGHEWAIQLLRGHIQQDALRHAYIITGQGGIGKKRISVRFIQAIFCTEPTEPGIPCGLCYACQRVNRLEHPDLFPVCVEDGSSQIKIDQIRDLIHHLSLTPFESSRRIGLLLDFEDANPPAQNALLKTLEEPPGDVILILTAQTSDSLLETITSRCEEIKLHPVPLLTISNELELKHGIPADQARFLAHISGGNPESALDYFQNPEAQELRVTLLDDHVDIIRSSAVDRFLYASKYEKDIEMVQTIITIWISLWHDVLLQSGNSHIPIQNIDRSSEIDQIVKQVDLPTAKRTLNLFRRAYSLIQENANLKLTFEDLLLQLPVLKLQ